MPEIYCINLKIFSRFSCCCSCLPCFYSPSLTGVLCKCLQDEWAYNYQANQTTMRACGTRETDLNLYCVGVPVSSPPWFWEHPSVGHAEWGASTVSKCSCCSRPSAPSIYRRRHGPREGARYETWSLRANSWNYLECKPFGNVQHNTTYQFDRGVRHSFFPFLLFHHFGCALHCWVCACCGGSSFRRSTSLRSFEFQPMLLVFLRLIPLRLHIF